MIAHRAVLQVTRAGYEKEVEDLIDELLEANNVMKQSRADHKYKDSSGYPKIDDILDK